MLFDAFAVVWSVRTAGENFVPEGILPRFAATVTFVCVVVEPGARTAAVTYEAPSYTGVIFPLFGWQDREEAARVLQQQVLLQQQLPGVVGAAGRC